MTVFFGEHWGAPILEYAQSAPTPLGVACYLCDRPIHRGDQGFIRPLITENGPSGNLPVHRGCDMAVTIGHLFGICSCTGWMTSTSAAKAGPAGQRGVAETH
jgi:hypothetical protein